MTKAKISVYTTLRHRPIDRWTKVAAHEILFFVTCELRFDAVGRERGHFFRRPVHKDDVDDVVTNVTLPFQLQSKRKEEYDVITRASLFSLEQTSNINRE